MNISVKPIIIWLNEVLKMALFGSQAIITPSKHKKKKVKQSHYRPGVAQRVQGS